MKIQNFFSNIFFVINLPKIKDIVTLQWYRLQMFEFKGKMSSKIQKIPLIINNNFQFGNVTEAKKGGDQATTKKYSLLWVLPQRSLS